MHSLLSAFNSFLIEKDDIHVSSLPFSFLSLLGITTLLTSSDSSDSNNDQDYSIYLIAMGACCAFFVCWHTMSLLTGVYLKTRPNRRKQTPAWCLRLCHCGGLAWLIALGVVSYLLGIDFGKLNFDITVIVMLGFICCQYLMVVYCIIEFCVDIFLCIDQTTVPDE